MTTCGCPWHAEQRSASRERRRPDYSGLQNCPNMPDREAMRRPRERWSESALAWWRALVERATA